MVWPQTVIRLLNRHLMIMFNSVMDPSFVQTDDKELSLFRACIERGPWLTVYFFLKAF